MAFGNQNGKTNGGFGSHSGSFGNSTSSKNDSHSNKKSYFGNAGSDASGNNSFGTKTKTTGGFGNNAYQSNNDANKQKATSIPQQNKSTTKSSTSTASANINSAINQHRHALVKIRGKVSQYRTYTNKSDNYRRLLPVKIYQAIVYGQRLEDLLHSFIVTEIKGLDTAGNPIQQKYVVNIHGSTNYGATLIDNEEVEVFGKFKDNTFMAKKINVINGAIPTPIKFQRSVKWIAIACLLAVFLLFGIIGFASMGSNNPISDFIRSVWSFITTMFTIYVILLFLYVISSFTRIGFMTRLLSGSRRRGSPLITMLIIAFVLTLLLYNVFGLGTIVRSSLSGVFGVVGPLIVMIIGIVLLFKAIK